MSEALQIPPRSLAEITSLIKVALVEAEESGIAYYRKIGGLLTEAREEHFRNKTGAFWKWVERNFGVGRVQATRYIDLARTRTPKRDFESIAEFDRSRGREHAGAKTPRRDYHAPIEKILEKVDTEALAREAQRRRDEIEQIRKLAEQIINIGFKALASKLHPDKKGGSRHAMSLLNAARDRLKRSL